MEQRDTDIEEKRVRQKTGKAREREIGKNEREGGDEECDERTAPR